MRLLFIYITLFIFLQSCVDDSPKYIQYIKGDYWVDNFRNNSYPSKALYNDKIYCSGLGIGPDEPNFFYCLNLKTGKIDWATEVKSWASQPPIICDSFIYYCSDIGDIYKFDMDGNKIWYNDLNSSYAGHCLNPVTKNLIVKTVASGLREFNKETGEIVRFMGKGILGVPLPVFRGDIIYQAGITDTLICKKALTDKILWKRKTGEVERVFTNQGELYYFDDTKILYCLNAENGNLIWQTDSIFDKQPLNPRLEFEKEKIICYFTSLNDMLLINSTNGKVEQRAPLEKLQKDGYLIPLVYQYKIVTEKENGYVVKVANTFEWHDYRNAFAISIIKN